ncbi:hypothetical protein [uncultured Psychroserpens sp.]|uniref:hypothetical protein n=1 Tax=uncultured Psychroserpens sp. TaxID=255436 RepID=UPI00262691AD|nr:hypothetical protein [uncultured Psychroserpens sp.]
MRLQIAILFLLASFISCNETTETKKSDNVPGEYFALKEDNINLFLPAYFREFSEDEYDALIEKMPDSEEKRIERKRFNFLKYSKGNMYYFKDVASSTLIGVKMGEYINFTKEESSYLLGVMSNSCSGYAEVLNMNCEKLNAGYSGSSTTKVFKAAYKISDGEAYNHYNTMYLISSNYKTFSVSIFSNTNKNYNSFIEKIVVK